MTGQEWFILFAVVLFVGPPVLFVVFFAGLLILSGAVHIYQAAVENHGVLGLALYVAAWLMFSPVMVIGCIVVAIWVWRQSSKPLFVVEKNSDH
jgi:hypothetical protein